VLLADIRRPDVKAFLARLHADGVGLHAIHTAHKHLRTILEAAVDDEVLVGHSAAKVKPPRIPQRRIRFLTEEEVWALADAIDPRYRALILLLCYAGLRIGEASYLRVRHFQVLASRIYVEGAAVHVDGGRRIEQETKTGKQRTVVLPRTIADVLRDHVEKFVGGWGDPEAFLFPGPTGAPLHPANFRNRQFARACRDAKLACPYPRVHDLRHTGATLALARGASEKQVADMLGHDDTRMVGELYGACSPRRTRYWRSGSTPAR
jgi:integrase